MRTPPARADAGPMAGSVRMTRTTPERPVDIEAMFPELAEYRRTTTRLHPRPGSPGRHESSVAGPFLWPADEPWPMCEAVHEKGHGVRDDEPIPLLAAAQLFTRDVPDLTGPEGCDLLQVFWCPFEVHGPERAMDVVLKWRRSQDVGDALTDNPEPVVVGRAECVPNTCVLDPEQVVEYEWPELLSEDVQERIDAWEEELMDAAAEEDAYELTYTHDLSIAPGWKVGGFATWGLTGPARIDCACGAPMRPLLTVSDREWDLG
ncbi:LigA protein, partial [Streptomyces himastatinicus ATCC 53653]